jgi:hypothetical protein
MFVMFCHANHLEADLQALCGVGALACMLAVCLHELLSRTRSARAAAAEVAQAPESKVKNPNPITAFKCDTPTACLVPLLLLQ